MNTGIDKRKIDILSNNMKFLGIREQDLEEKFIRSRGRGGQKLNKTASCVYLKHIPSGIDVKCDQDRSQALNRFLARRRLVQKIEAGTAKYQSELRKRIEKIRRQKRKRSQRAKEKMLVAKRKQSDKKKARSLPVVAD